MNKEQIATLMLKIHQNESISESDKSEYLKMLSALSDSDDTLEIFSIQDANALLMEHLGPSEAAFRRRLIDYIVDPAHEVHGLCDEYHNFLMDMFRLGDFSLSLKVCDFVLQSAPYSCDILGDAIKACCNSNLFDRGEEYISMAQDIPYDFWTYRLFMYSIDFLREKLVATSDKDPVFEQALQLINEYIRRFPKDEHGYNQRAELLIAMNKTDEAIEDLKHSIFEVQPDAHNADSSLICAQCCVTLLDLLDDSTDYKLIIRVCDAGLRHTAQSKPSANVGYFMYRKALALDAMAQLEDCLVGRTLIAALRCYQAAYDLNQDRDYARTIEKRYAVLRPYAEDVSYTKPLYKRPLFISQYDEE